MLIMKYYQLAVRILITGGRSHKVGAVNELVSTAHSSHRSVTGLHLPTKVLSYRRAPGRRCVGGAPGKKVLERVPIGMVRGQLGRTVKIYDSNTIVQKLLQKNKSCCTFFVEASGFEPKLWEPKSQVLPLHHASIEVLEAGLEPATLTL